MGIEKNYVTCILIAFLFITKLNTFLKILLMMLKDGLIQLTMMKMIKIIKELCALSAKTWTYLMDDDSEHKEQKGYNKT